MAEQYYKIESLGRQLGIGIAGSRYVSLSAIAKSNGPNAPYCIPSELICCELGRFIGLPIPPVAMVSEPGGGVGPVFASLDFNLAGNTLPPVDVAKCLQLLPSLSTGLLLFDIWMANCDRHPANFSVDFLSTPPQMSVFDHSHALFGYTASGGQSRLQQLRDRLGISWKTNNPVDSGKHRHCLLDSLNLDDHFAHWHDRIKLTPDFFVQDRCEAALAFGATQLEVDAAVDFILHRRDRMMSIIKESRAEFTGIKTWRLFP